MSGSPRDEPLCDRLEVILLSQSDRIEFLFLVSLMQRSGFSRWGKCGERHVAEKKSIPRVDRPDAWQRNCLCLMNRCVMVHTDLSPRWLGQ
jgi:hypothetical protein